MITKALVLLALLCTPQEEDPFEIPGEESEVKILSTSVDPESARPGDVVQVKIHVLVKEEWHLSAVSSDPSRSVPLVFGLDKKVPGQISGKVVEPKPKMFDLFGIISPVHEGEVEFSFPVRISGEAKSGEIFLSGFMRGQTCADVCINVDLPFRVALKVEEAEVRILSTSVEPESARSGDVVQVKIRVRVKEKWHLNAVTADPSKAVPLTFEFDKKVPVQIAGKIVEPKPDKFKLFDTISLAHEGDVEFSFPVRISGKAKSGEIFLSGFMRGQACTDVCVPVDLPFRVALKVLPSGKEPAVRLLSITPEKKTVKGGESLSVKAELGIEPEGYVVVKGSGKAEVEGPFTVENITLSGGSAQIRLRVKEDASPGKIDLSGKLTVTISDGKENVVRTVKWMSPGIVEIQEAVAISKGEEGSGGEGQSEEAKELLQKGFLGFLLACVLGGLISLIMPCVYPLIPITLTFFVKQSGGSKSRSAGLAFMYGLGIIITFTGLGFLLSKIIGAVGARVFAGDPWVNLVIAFVFLLLAVSLLGMFELKLPGFITNKVGGSAPKQGFFGAFGLGLIFAVVTFTCTIPVAGGLLSLAAGGGSAGWALSGMLVYSVTMAFPFLMLGFFPGLLQKIPRSGGWLQTVKVGAGFLELALVFYYLAKADFGFFGIDGYYMSRDMVLAIWVAIMVATSLWLLGIWRFKKDPEAKGIGYGRAFWAFVFGVFGFWLATGLAGNQLGGFETVLPISKDLDRPQRVEAELARIKRLVRAGGDGQIADIKGEYLDYDEGLEAAKLHSMPVFIDFTGFT